MKKLEQTRLVAYPIKNVKIHKGYSGDFVDYDKNAEKKIFVEGYEQAEKDFIEKALAYLNEKFYFNNLHYAVENNTFNCMEELFEDFEKYLRGE